MQICFPCTSCNKPLLVGDSASNTQVECPICHRLVLVPDIREAVPALQALSSNLTTTIRPASQPPLPQAANNNLPELNSEKTIMVKLAPQIFSSTPESKPEVEEEPVLEVDLEPLVEEEETLFEKEEPLPGLQGDFSLEETEPVEPVSFEIIPDPVPRTEDTISGKDTEKPFFLLEEPVRLQPLEKPPPNIEEPSSSFRSSQMLSAEIEDTFFTTMLVEKPVKEQSSVGLQVLPDLQLAREGGITTKPGRVKDIVSEEDQLLGEFYRVEPPPDATPIPEIMEKEKDLSKVRLWW